MVAGDYFSDQSMSDRGEPEPPCLILDFGLRILDFRNWCIFVSDFEFRICSFTYNWCSLYLFLRVLRVLRGQAFCHPSSLLRMALSPVERVTTKSTKVTKSGSLLVPRTHFPGLPLRLCARYSLARHSEATPCSLNEFYR